MPVHPKARTEGIISETVGDDVVLYDTASTTAHSLSVAAASVWNLCDGILTVDEIAAQSGVTREFAEATLVELDRTNLLEPTPMLGRMSRRDFGRLATRAAIAAPIILSVAVPVAQAAISCRVTNGGTTDTCTASAGAFGASSAGGSGLSCCSSGSCYKAKTSGTFYCVASSGSCAAFGADCHKTACCAGSTACVGTGNNATCNQ